MDRQGEMTGPELRDQALLRLEDAHERWIEDALAAIRLICRHRDEFTTDAVWAIVGDPPKEPRAMGAVIRRAVSQGLIERTDRSVNSVRPECHSRPVRVWRVRR